MLEDFLGCENFRNLRKFVGCEISQHGIVHLLLLQLFVSCNPPFDVPEIKFSNLLSQAFNGHKKPLILTSSHLPLLPFINPCSISFSPHKSSCQFQKTSSPPL